MSYFDKPSGDYYPKLGILGVHYPWRIQLTTFRVPLTSQAPYFLPLTIRAPYVANGLIYATQQDNSGCIIVSFITDLSIAEEE